jgi:hypothetical protein
VALRAIGLFRALTLGGLVMIGHMAGADTTWTMGATGKGTARWTMEGTGVAYRGGAAFGWAVTGEPLHDGFVETRFRAVAGREDRAGGVVWRWSDANDYYVARANALEDNVVAYKMVAGRRSDLKPVGADARAYGVKTKVASDVWHTLRVDFAGPEFVVSFDGARLFSVRDETFAGAGRVGVWSKADSVTEFDAFRAGPPQR